MLRFNLRRFRQWIAVPILLTQIGCAARGVQVDASPAAVSEAEWKACEEYSNKQKQKSVVGMTALGVLLLPVGVALGGIGAMGGRPDGVMIPIVAVEKATDNARANRTTREAALKLCLEPLRLQQALGPGHPDVARSLNALANGYVSIGELAKAVPVYQRALSIRENALGLDHPDVASTLEDYATLLRKAGRDSEAAELEGRARAIRAKSEQQSREGAPLPMGAVDTKGKQ